MSLKKQTFSGFIWTFIDVLLIKSLLFIGSIIIARWIGPKEFGLAGMITVFIALGRTLTDSGMTNSLIRLKTATKEDYSTVFLTNLGMSLLIYVVLFISAPLISAFFHQDVLVNVLRVYGAIFLLIALSAVQLAKLSKEMNFKKITIINAPSTIVGVSIGLWLAYHNYGVWSIVGMFLAMEFVRMILLWLLSNWKVSFVFSQVKFKEHFSFGSKLLLSGIIDTVFKNVYNIIIGRVYMPQVLGFYERSREFATYPSTTLTSIIIRVTYPMMSKMQDEPVRLARIYRKLIQISFFIISPILIALAALAKPIFLIVLGEEWIPAVPYFQVLCLAMMFYPIHKFNLDVLKVFGRSDLFLKLELIKKGILIIALVGGYQFGIIGLLWSNVFSSVASLVVNAWYSSKFINYKASEQVYDLLKISVLTAVMGVSMYFVEMKMTEWHIIARLFISAFLGISCYLGLNYFYKKGPLFQTIDLIKNRNR